MRHRATGDRRHAEVYPACRRKCGALLPFMLLSRRSPRLLLGALAAAVVGVPLFVAN